MLQVRQDFPLFNTYPKLAYLDNAASSQKPQVVLDALLDFYTTKNANVHRGMYPLSEIATGSYELARETVAEFIGAKAREIIFTSGTTDSINGAASMIAKYFSEKREGQRDKGGNNREKSDDEIVILVTGLEHHSNIVPWQEIPNAKLVYAKVNGNYEVDFSDIDIEPDIVAVTMCSNVTGTIIDIGRVREMYPNALLVVDAAQAVAHFPIDVKALNVDMLSFSGHKMYGPTGIGALYIKDTLLDALSPFRFGGGMIEEVKRDSSTWALAPEKFEAGTPNIAGAWGLKAAVEYLVSIGFEAIQESEREMNEYTYNKLSSIEGLTLFHPSNASVHGGVFSFVLDGIHAHDLSYLLGERDIATRAGHHCAQILHREVFKVPATTRCSLGVYSTKEEIDRLVEEIKEVRQGFKN